MTINCNKDHFKPPKICLYEIKKSPLVLAERVTHASPLTAHQALCHMSLPANVLVQSYHSFSKVGGSGFQSLVFFISPDVRCSTHDQSKEKDVWLRLQHLLDMTSQSAYADSVTVTATSIYTASTTGFRYNPLGDTHFHFGLPSQC